MYSEMYVVRFRKKEKKKGEIRKNKKKKEIKKTKSSLYP